VNAHIVDGIPVSPARFLALVQPEDDQWGGEPPLSTFLLDWAENRKPIVGDLGFVAARLAALDGGTLVVGRLGRVRILDHPRDRDEVIDGPHTYGFLCDAAAIGGSVYATGMSRQVYRRAPDGRWSHDDAGVLDESLDVDSVSGFRAIHGIHEDELYAVGYNGEIWVKAGTGWQQLDSPTNVILERVHVVHPDLVYAAGQGGVILTGRRTEWHVLEQDVTAEDFWAIEWFGERLYLASRSGLFRLQPGGELEPVDTGMGRTVKYGQLRVSDGFLWSFGPSYVLRSTDGEAWTQVRIGDFA
jgi:hypothetical protein